ncbi:MAG: MerR family transcriptional regulator [Acidiferrobacteraceae bacterium]
MPQSPSDIPLTIGALARAAGVHVETVRYYQRRGLLAEPAKPPGGIRHYSREAVERLRFIRRAQEIGFTLAEIHELLGLGSRACAETRQRAEQKMQDIDQRVAGLREMQRMLRSLVRHCTAGRAGPCPLYERLTDGRRALTNPKKPLT